MKLNVSDQWLQTNAECPIWIEDIIEEVAEAKYCYTKAAPGANSRSSLPKHEVIHCTPHLFGPRSFVGTIPYGSSALTSSGCQNRPTSDWPWQHAALWFCPAHFNKTFTSTGTQRPHSLSVWNYTWYLVYQVPTHLTTNPSTDHDLLCISDSAIQYLEKLAYIMM